SALGQVNYGHLLADEARGEEGLAHSEVVMELQTQRRYRSLEELIQSQLSELTGPIPGIVFVQHQLKRLDAYTTIRSGIDFTDHKALKLLKWVDVNQVGDTWTCDEMSETDRNRFIENVA